MEHKKITEAVVHKLLSDKIIMDSSYKIISTGNNIVSRLKKSYLKIYVNGKTTIRDSELLLYKVSTNPKLYKKLLHTNALNIDDECFQYALFDEVTGKTLDEVTYSNELAEKIAGTIFVYIKDTTQIPCSRFGEFDENFEGSHDNFMEYIFDLVHKSSTVLFKESSTREYSILPYNLLVDNVGLFENIKDSLIIPVDFHFKNFIVTDDNRTVVIDPGALIAGPLEMAYGEFMAHAHGTLLYQNFKKHIGNVDEKLIRIFAIFTLTNTLAHFIKYKIAEPRKAKPSGNTKTYFELIDEHRLYLQTYRGRTHDA
jgi:hypothetical protein